MEQALTRQAVLDRIDYNVHVTNHVCAFIEHGNTISVPNRKVLYKDDGEFISVMGSHYKVVPHANMVNATLDAFDSKGIEYEIAQLDSTNNKLNLHIRHPETFSIDEHGNDLKMDTIITNSYDGSLPFGFELGAFRMVCLNGMRTGHTENKIVKRHSGQLNQDIVIGNYVEHMKIFSEEIVPFLKSCREKGIKKVDGLQMLKEMNWLGKRLMKQAVELWAAEEENKNVWGLMQVLTYLTTHVVKSYNRRRDLEIRTYNSIRASMR